MTDRLVSARRFRTLQLQPHRNNVGITAAPAAGRGRFNVWGNSLPAEHVPGGGRITVDGVPFEWPSVVAGNADNVRCAGQLIEVVRGRYDWLYVLAASERRAEDEVALHFADGSVDFEALRVSDFWAAPAVFGETEAVATPVMHYPHHVQPGVPAKVWCQRVPVTRRADLAAVRLPRNVALHVFAATVCAPGTG